MTSKVIPANGGLFDVLAVVYANAMLTIGPGVLLFVVLTTSSVFVLAPIHTSTAHLAEE